MNLVEVSANRVAAESLRPLEVSSAVGPVLATPAYAAYGGAVAGAFTLGLISDAVESHQEGGDDLSLTGPVPEGAEASDLIATRLDGLR